MEGLGEYIEAAIGKSASVEVFVTPTKVTARRNKSINSNKAHIDSTPKPQKDSPNRAHDEQ